MALILIVDDEPNIVLSLEYLVKREGYEAAIAPDGEAALAALAERTPDLVVLDVMLPKMNGFELCERIRADPRWRETKILGQDHQECIGPVARFGVKPLIEFCPVGLAPAAPPLHQLHVDFVDEPAIHELGQGLIGGFRSEPAGAAHDGADSLQMVPGLLVVRGQRGLEPLC